MAEYGLQNTRGTLIALSGAVGLVLIIACVNVASLQVALGLARRREFVTRLALGASRTRLSRQLLAEALVIAAIGCGGGIAVSWLATRTLELLLPPGFLRLPFRGDIDVTLDTTVVAFAATVSFISALLFAFAPMLGLKGDSLQPALRDGARGATRSAATTRRVLVTAEIALAIVVLVGAGLMMRSMLHLLAVQPGLDPHNVLSMRVSLPQHDTYGAPERTDFCRNLAREVGSLPGVMQVSAVSHLPLGGSNASRAITIEGRPEPPPDSIASAAYRLACPGYFAALGIRLIAGRDFTDSDSLNAPRVVIVNRTLVERYWKDGDALGQRLKIGGYRSGNPYLTIIGIVDSVRHFGLDAGPSREIFLPYSQQAWPVMTIVAKTAGDPLIWDRQVRAALTRVESSLPAAQTRVMEDVVRQSVGWREAPMRLLTAFAVIGLLLAAIGVYGVLAYYVSQRTREFGVRTALGASRRTLVALVLRQSATPIAVGTGLGVAASFAATTLLSRFLYEVQPGDPVVLASVVALLTLVALFSSWLPARRAAAIDPITALRNE
jgi:putative ABC transport system permease protein